MNGVVPLAMKHMRLKVHARELGIGDAPARGVDAVIQSAPHGEARRRRGGGDQVHNDLMGDERLAAPVLCDEREQAVFNLVPLARARR